MERIDKLILPMLATREALSNAICHKNYSIPNSAITLAIFDDRLEFWNCGTLPSSLNIEDLKHIREEDAQALSQATVHWLRHTEIAEDLKIRPREHVRDDAGHSSSSITDKYIDVNLSERHASAKKKMLKP